MSRCTASGKSLSSSENVLPTNLINHVQIKATPRSEAGIGIRGAGGERIWNHGSSKSACQMVARPAATAWKRVRQGLSPSRAGAGRDSTTDRGSSCHHETYASRDRTPTKLRTPFQTEWDRHWVSRIRFETCADSAWRREEWCRDIKGIQSMLMSVRQCVLIVAACREMQHRCWARRTGEQEWSSHFLSRVGSRGSASG